MPPPPPSTPTLRRPLSYSTGLGNYGKSAIFYAITRGRGKFVRILLDRGATVRVVNNKGQSPLSLAASHFDTELVAYMEAHEQAEGGGGGDAGWRSAAGGSELSGWVNFRATNSDGRIYGDLDPRFMERPVDAHADVVTARSINPTTKATRSRRNQTQTQTQTQTQMQGGMGGGTDTMTNTAVTATPSPPQAAYAPAGPSSDALREAWGALETRIAQRGIATATADGVVGIGGGAPGVGCENGGGGSSDVGRAAHGSDGGQQPRPAADAIVAIGRDSILSAVNVLVLLYEGCTFRWMPEAAVQLASVLSLTDLDALLDDCCGPAVGGGAVGGGAVGGRAVGGGAGETKAGNGDGGRAGGRVGAPGAVGSGGDCCIGSGSGRSSGSGSGRDSSMMQQRLPARTYKLRSRLVRKAWSHIMDKGEDGMGRILLSEVQLETPADYSGVRRGEGQRGGGGRGRGRGGKGRQGVPPRGPLGGPHPRLVLVGAGNTALVEGDIALHTASRNAAATLSGSDVATLSGSDVATLSGSDVATLSGSDVAIHAVPPASASLAAASAALIPAPLPVLALRGTPEWVDSIDALRALRRTITDCIGTGNTIVAFDTEWADIDPACIHTAAGVGGGANGGAKGGAHRGASGGARGGGGGSGGVGGRGEVAAAATTVIATLQLATGASMDSVASPLYKQHAAGWVIDACPPLDAATALSLAAAAALKGDLGRGLYLAELEDFVAWLWNRSGACLVGFSIGGDMTKLNVLAPGLVIDRFDSPVDSPPRMGGSTGGGEMGGMGGMGGSNVALVDLQLLSLQRGCGAKGRPPGLRRSCEHFLKASLCKEEQCSDWSRRPLLDTQLRYAALDAVVLPRLLHAMGYREPGRKGGGGAEERGAGGGDVGGGDESVGGESVGGGGGSMGN
jgi:hypothetical protein